MMKSITKSSGSGGSGSGGGGAMGGMNPMASLGGKGSKAQFSIPGLANAWKEALDPIRAEEPQLAMIIQQLQWKGWYVVEKYQKDDRSKERLSPTKAKALIEEYVDHLMSVFLKVCWDKPWFSKVNF